MVHWCSRRLHRRRGVFPVVWTVLYLMMGVASVLVWKADAPQAEKKQALTWYVAQLAVNFVWPLLFFNAGLYGIALGVVDTAAGIGGGNHHQISGNQPYRRLG